MTSAIDIITADTSHTSLLSKLGYDTFYETFAHQNNPADFTAYITQAFHPEQIEKEINEPGSIYFIAFAAGEPVGYARLRESTEVNDVFPNKRTIELQRIYVTKSYLGKNLGKILLDYCLTEARKKEIEILWLGVWEHNARAIRFYEKCGFKKFSSHTFMMGSDAQTDILMKIDLP
jgi:diamine N-acetyltransferase